MANLNSKNRKRNVDLALELLRGKTVLANDRRKGDAPAIEFKSYRRPGVRVISPVYGISDTLHKTLSKLADKVTFDGLPYYHFSL